MEFRKLEFSDLDKLGLLKNESWMTTHQTTICNLDDQKRWFNSLSEDVHTPKTLVVVAEVEDSSVGVFKWKIDWQNRTADAGWDIFKDYRNKGMGKKLVALGVKYSFECLGLRRLTAEILTNNEASIKCAEHAGFIKEGCKRDAVQKGMLTVDSLVYGILQPTLI